MSTSFNWTVRPDDWPPSAVLRPPFTLTQVEIARSCPLRVVFEATKRYEPLVGFDARVGVALHEALERLSTNPLTGDDSSRFAQVRAMFSDAMAVQRREAGERPRERGLPESAQRVEAALAALMRAVQGGGSLALKGQRRSGPMTFSQAERTVYVETSVRTKDGHFAGRVDRAERSQAGLMLLDFKFSMLEEVPERYVRQLQMYAEMWADTLRERPSRAVVVYPLTERRFEIDVSPAATKRVVEESRAVVQPLVKGASPNDLAKPGSVCKVCGFRPWCQPFWGWVSGAGLSLPVALERSGVGFQGEVISTRPHRQHLVLEIAWHPRSRATLMIPLGAAPHVHNISPGTRVRVTGTKLEGQVTAPRALWTAFSEIYLVEE